MTAHPIAILSDSTCDIPQPLIEEYAIQIIPQIVIWGEKLYRDRVEIQPEEFYQRLVSDPVRPTTSQASALDFSKAYQQAIEQGAKEIIVLTVSSAMSGTYQNALKTAEEAEVRVHVVDSKGPTMSLGWQVLAAARLRQTGENVQTILNQLDQIRKKLVQFVGMDTLEYLQRGGRIGGAAKWVGMMLQIKPVVAINHATGLVEQAGIARTYKKMIELLYQKFFETIGHTGSLRVAVLHGNAPEEAEKLAERIRVEYAPKELLVNITGPVLGINTGPNALAICGYRE